MSRVEKYKRGWRVTFLILLFIAIIGPWFLDRINIPAPYDCPGIRLDDNFCGTPKSILWILMTILFNLPDFITSLFSRPGNSAALIFLLVLLIIVVPPLSSLFLIFYEDHSRRKKAQISLFSLGAAAAISFAIAIQIIPDFSSSNRVLWGVWLYIIAATITIILESVLLLKTQPAAYG
jgi:hypothetical protein